MYYEKPKERPQIGKFLNFDHILIWCGNAKQAANFYITKLGFNNLAYSGLENGNREWATTVVSNGRIIIALQTPYGPNNEFTEQMNQHGDGVRDVAFEVEDCRKTYEVAISRGAVSIMEPKVLEDKNGKVIVATIKTLGDTRHSFVQRNEFKGLFLPGYEPLEKDPIVCLLGEVKFNYIDHVVLNHKEIGPNVEFYEKVLDFHKYWSIDDSILHTEYSALNSVVVADYDEVIRMPQNEPSYSGLRKSQIQEYVEYYNGSGVQHIAINVSNIIETIDNLTKRGLRLLTIPKTYYDNLRKNLQHSKVCIKEDIDTLEKLQILVDYDDNGYLLQIFTMCVEDRPTLFYEFIQRANHNGFGAGNFKALFESIERDQEKRGNLI